MGTNSVRQVVRIDWNTVASHSWSGKEGREPEWLCAGASDRVPKVNLELTAEPRHLVHQSDVDVPVGVLKQFRHLRLSNPFCLHDVIDKRFGRCVTCGQCGEACPLGLPVHLLAFNLAETVQHEYGAVSGLSLDEASPMSVYKPEDTTNFIR